MKTLIRRLEAIEARRNANRFEIICKHPLHDVWTLTVVRGGRVVEHREIEACEARPGAIVIERSYAR